jgi:hypothetical protein
MVGYLEATFSCRLNTTPNDDLEKVGDGYAVTQEESGLARLDMIQPYGGSATLTSKRTDQPNARFRRVPALQ